jgi:hypothetical protein
MQGFVLEKGRSSISAWRFEHWEGMDAYAWLAFDGQA